MFNKSSRRATGRLGVPGIVAAFLACTTISPAQERTQEYHSTTTEIRGTVFKFVLKEVGSKESRLHLFVANQDDEVQEWVAVLGNADELISEGLVIQAFSPGEELVVSGNPALDSDARRILVTTIKREDGSVWSR